MIDGVLLPIREPEVWEGDRFCRDPLQPVEAVIHRRRPTLFFGVNQFLQEKEARCLALLAPAVAANLHFLGQWHIYSRLYNTYRTPPRSRARAFAEEWEAAAERARRPALHDW